MRRALLFALALVAYRAGLPAAQTAPQPHPPVVRSSREIAQPRAAILAADGDAAGNVYVTGYATSGLQTRPDAFQPANRGGTYDAFAAKLDAAGNLIWATYIGGSAGTALANRIQVAAEMGTEIKVDSAGNVYVVGGTPSRDFPTVNAFQGTNAAAATGFIVKLDPAGQHALYSSYIGGINGATTATHVAVTSLGEAYVLGRTFASDFPGSHHIGARGAPYRPFVAYVGPTGQLREAFTFGSSGGDEIAAAALDGAGALHLAGRSYSKKDFPTTDPAPTCVSPFESCGASFVMKFAPSAGPLVYSRLIGDANYQVVDVSSSGSAIAIDAQGRAVFVGSTRSAAWPLVNAFQSQLAGSDAFLTRLTPDGTIDFSTLIGGTGDDQFDRIRIDPAGAIVIGGSSNSVDFPLRSPLSEHPDVGVMRSDNAGSTWQRIPNTLPGTNFVLRGVDPVDPLRMYATWDDYPTRGVMGRTDDGGLTWIRLTEPAPYSPSSIFAVSPSRSVYHIDDLNGAAVLLRRSDDFGVTWRTIATGTCCGTSALYLGGLAFTPLDPNRIYQATSFGVRVSTDGGATWTARSSGIPPTNIGTVPFIDAIAASPATIGTLWISLSPGSIYRTVDDGLTWARVYADPAENNPTLAAAPDGATVYAGTTYGVLVSRDGGATWRRSPIGQPQAGRVIRGVAADPEHPSTVYSYGTYGRTDIWKSTDYGQTWIDITPRQVGRGAVAAMMIPRSRPDTVFAAGPVATAKVMVRLTGDAIPRIETSSFLGPLGSYGEVMTIAGDGDAILFGLAVPAGSPPYTMTRIGKWFPPLCGRGGLLAGVFAPQADVCAP